MASLFRVTPGLQNVQFASIDDESVNGFPSDVPEYATNGTLISWGSVTVDTTWLHALPLPIWNRTKIPLHCKHPSMLSLAV